MNKPLASPEVKRLSMTLTQIEADGTFSGYASLFHVPDMSRDVVMPGAFRESLTKRGGAGGIRLLWQHDPSEPIGRWLELYEDARGLFAKGQLNLQVARAREVYALLIEGALDGLSIGFKTQKARKDAASQMRHIERVDLWEISIVTFPMLPQARISAVKGNKIQEIMPEARISAVKGNTFSPTPNPNRPSQGHKPMQDFDNQSSPASSEIKEAFEGFMRTFEHFKDSNDERLTQMERRLTSDVVTEEKVARLDQALIETKNTLDGLLLKNRRPQLSAASARLTSFADNEHKAAFQRYMRSGEADGLKTLEAKALSSATGADGGYLLPSETESDVLRRMAALSPIRALATVRTINGATFSRPITKTGPETGWVGETAARPETDSQTLAEVSLAAMELYAMPAASQSLLDDTAINVEQWIAEEVEAAFAEQESAAFITGNGTNKPKGFLDSTKVANASWEWDKLGYIATGAAGAFASSNASDCLIDLVYSLKAGYRQNGTFIMNRKTQSALRKLKDGQGNYLWQPPVTAGGAATLMNFPLSEAEDMPDIAADSFSIAFGDFRRGYLIVDRQGVRILRDPYSAKPYVLFYTTKRVGGGVQDFAAIKLLKFAAS